MFVDVSKLEPESKGVWYGRSYINTNNIVYVRQYLDDRNKTIIKLMNDEQALIDNDIDDVCKILNELEMNNGQ